MINKSRGRPRKSGRLAWSPNPRLQRTPSAAPPPPLSRKPLEPAAAADAAGFAAVAAEPQAVRQPAVTSGQDRQGASARPAERCSFCNQPRNSPGDFVWGPEVKICEDCIDICIDIVAEKRMPSITPTDARVHCVLCRLEWPQEKAVAIPKKGWLCRECFGEVHKAGSADEQGT